jgi:hypothetical protein
MAFMQPCPFLIAEDDEIQFIKGLDILLDSHSLIGEFLQFLLHRFDLRLHSRRVTSVLRVSRK